MLYIGQKVMCISNKPYEYNLNVGETYIIEALHACSCGTLFIAVGTRPFAKILECLSCRNLINSEIYDWWNSKRFIPIDPTEEEIKEYSQPETQTA